MLWSKLYVVQLVVSKWMSEWEAVRGGTDCYATCFHCSCVIWSISLTSVCEWTRRFCNICALGSLEASTLTSHQRMSLQKPSCFDCYRHLKSGGTTFWPLKWKNFIFAPQVTAQKVLSMTVLLPSHHRLCCLIHLVYLTEKCKWQDLYVLREKWSEL